MLNLLKFLNKVDLNFQISGKFSGIFCSILTLLFLSSCGVKAPPLPPIPVTPQQAELQEANRNEPIPSPSPSPTPKSNKKSAKKRSSR